MGEGRIGNTFSGANADAAATGARPPHPAVFASEEVLRSEARKDGPASEPGGVGGRRLTCEGLGSASGALEGPTNAMAPGEVPATARMARTRPSLCFFNRFQPSHIRRHPPKLRDYGPRIGGCQREIRRNPAGLAGSGGDHRAPPASPRDEEASGLDRAANSSATKCRPWQSRPTESSVENRTS